MERNLSEKHGRKWDDNVIKIGARKVNCKREN
jgi:hypothetical protein